MTAIQSPRSSKWKCKCSKSWSGNSHRQRWICGQTGTCPNGIFT